jgi:hypothetical protein
MRSRLSRASAAPGDEQVAVFLERLDRADEAQEANRLGEDELNADRLGENGNGGAMAHFSRGIAAASGRRPGDAGDGSRGKHADPPCRTVRLGRRLCPPPQRWLDQAGKVRPGFAAVDDARGRIAMQRMVRVGRLRDMGLAALSREDGINEARSHLVTLLRIAPSADPAAAELRQRIDLATHYGLFRPGQVFTDAIRNGGRGPQMAVIPHGAFRMGAGEGEPGEESERPARNIRFERGLAVSRFEITVGEYRPLRPRQRPPVAIDAARLFDCLRRAQRQLRASRQRRLAVRLRRQPRQPTRCRWCMSASRTPRPTRNGCRHRRPALPAAQRGRIRVRAARRRTGAVSVGRWHAAGRHGKFHWCIG